MKKLFFVIASLILLSCTTQTPTDNNEPLYGQLGAGGTYKLLNSTFEQNKDIDPCLNQRMINVSVFGKNASGRIIFDNLNASFISVAPFNLTNKTEQSLGKVFHCGSDIAVYYVPQNNMTTREMMMNKTQFKNPFNISGNEVRDYIRSFPQDSINNTRLFFDMNKMVGGE